MKEKVFGIAEGAVVGVCDSIELSTTRSSKVEPRGVFESLTIWLWLVVDE